MHVPTFFVLVPVCTACLLILSRSRCKERKGDSNWQVAALAFWQPLIPTIFLRAGRDDSQSFFIRRGVFHLTAVPGQMMGRASRAPARIRL
jgi:hypothetical protein